MPTLSPFSPCLSFSISSPLFIAAIAPLIRRVFAPLRHAADIFIYFIIADCFDAFHYCARWLRQMPTFSRDYFHDFRHFIDCATALSHITDYAAIVWFSTPFDEVYAERHCQLILIYDESRCRRHCCLRHIFSLTRCHFRHIITPLAIASADAALLRRRRWHFRRIRCHFHYDATPLFHYAIIAYAAADVAIVYWCRHFRHWKSFVVWILYIIHY